jgi:hypothetical protein
VQIGHTVQDALTETAFVVEVEFQPHINF